MIARKRFLAALTAAGLSPAVLRTRVAAEVTQLQYALVLSGGGARGVYEAGVVGALLARDGIRDGTPLAPYELICGTSIGALNGWFVATGQYAKLRELWNAIGGQRIIKLKPQYAALRDPTSGVLDRVVAAIRLSGLTRNQTGLLQSEPVFEWITQNVDPTVPLLMPLVWATTNLSMQRPEYFFLRPRSGADLPEMLQRALRLSLGPQTIVREATPELLQRALFASAAIPIAFDPVLMPGPDDEVNAYCDGGVASNSPVGIAHAVSRAADVILLDPPFQPETDDSGDALEVAFAAFGTAQRKILEVEMRNTYFQSLARRIFEHLTPQEMTEVSQGDDQLAAYLRSISETELRYIRPEQALPLRTVAFDDAGGITKAYLIGWKDVARGFTPYHWATFAL